MITLALSRRITMRPYFATVSLDTESRDPSVLLADLVADEPAADSALY